MFKSGDIVRCQKNYFNGHLENSLNYIVDQVWNEGKYFSIKGIEKEYPYSEHFDTCFFEKIKK